MLTAAGYVLNPPLVCCTQHQISTSHPCPILPAPHLTILHRCRFGSVGTSSASLRQNNNAPLFCVHTFYTEQWGRITAQRSCLEQAVWKDLKTHRQSKNANAITSNSHIFPHIHNGKCIVAKWISNESNVYLHTAYTVYLLYTEFVNLTLLRRQITIVTETTMIIIQGHNLVWPEFRGGCLWFPGNNKGGNLHFPDLPVTLQSRRFTRPNEDSPDCLYDRTSTLFSNAVIGWPSTLIQVCSLRCNAQGGVW